MHQSIVLEVLLYELDEPLIEYEEMFKIMLNYESHDRDDILNSIQILRVLSDRDQTLL
jgi:hypothetical protein